MQSFADSSVLSKVEEILEDAVNREPALSSAAVMTAEGFPLVLLMGRGEDEKLELAAAIASLGSLSEQTAGQLRIGKYKDLILRCGRGHLLVRRIGNLGMLAVITKPKAQLGACYIVMDATAARLRRAMK